jgi:hypothetical protein
VATGAQDTTNRSKDDPISTIINFEVFIKSLLFLEFGLQSLLIQKNRPLMENLTVGYATRSLWSGRP